MSLRHLALLTRDLRGTERFYTDVLGLEEAFAHEGMIFLRTPGREDLLNFVETRRPFDPTAGGLDLYAYLRESYPGLPGDAELEDELTALTLGSIRRRCAPMPGVPDVLESTRRRGYRLALASSAVPAVIAANLAALGVFSLFETIVSGVEVASGKPAPDIFLEAARRLAVPTEHCLVVEDSRNGVLAARAAGMVCVAVPCPATRDEDFREATLRLEALPALLGLLPQRPSTSVPSGKSR